MVSAALLLGAALATLSSLDVIEPAIRVETRAGISPPASIMPGGFFLAMATPSLAFLSTETGKNSQATLSSRLLLREPAPTGSPQILARHSLVLSQNRQHSARWSRLLDFRGSYGEEDYTTIRDTLAASTGGSPSSIAPVPPGSTTSGTSQQTATAPRALSMMNVGATVRMGYRHSRIAESNLQLDTIYRDGLNTSRLAQDNSSRLVRQSVSGASLSYSEALTRTLRFETSLRESYTHVAGQMDTLVTQATMGLGETISRYNSIAITVGTTYVSMLRESAGQASPGLLPTANLSWNGTLSNERDEQIHANATLGYDWGFDPLTGMGATRVPINLRIDCLLENRLSITAAIGYLTTFSLLTTPTSASGSADRTMFTAALPITYRWNDRLTIESGARMNLTGPAWAGPSELSGLELWGYAAITASTRHRLN